MDDIFARATKAKIRFETSKGLLSVEDLWDLPLTSDTGRANLDEIATVLKSHIESGVNTSFFEPEKGSDPRLQLAMDVVKYVGETKIAERRAAVQAKETRETKQRIRELIVAKKDEALQGKSAEELEALLASL